VSRQVEGAALSWKECAVHAGEGPRQTLRAAILAAQSARTNLLVPARGRIHHRCWPPARANWQPSILPARNASGVGCAIENLMPCGSLWLHAECHRQWRKADAFARQRAVKAAHLWLMPVVASRDPLFGRSRIVTPIAGL